MKKINSFNKKWINVSFFIVGHYDKKLTHKQIQDQIKVVHDTVKSLFMSAQFENLLNKRISPIVISKENIERNLKKKGVAFNWESDKLGNPEVTHQKFEISVEDKGEGNYIFRVFLDPYSLNEFLFDGYAIYKTNEELIKINKWDESGKQKGLVCKMEFDEKDNPVETSLEGFVLITYLMKDRIKQAEFSNKFDSIRKENVPKLIKRLKKNVKHEIEKKWVEKVEELLMRN